MDAASWQSGKGASWTPAKDASAESTGVASWLSGNKASAESAQDASAASAASAKNDGKEGDPTVSERLAEFERVQCVQATQIGEEWDCWHAWLLPDYIGQGPYMFIG